MNHTSLLFYHHQWITNWIFFHPSRGLRQGDHLSLILFILGNKVLSKLIFIEELQNNIEGISLPRRGPSLTRLLFVDDLILFGTSSSPTDQSFASCLDSQASWSRQNKS